MKLRITPLFLASLGVIVFGFFYIFHKIDSSFGPLAGILVIFLGILSLGMYFILLIVFRTRLWLQLLSELLFIVVVSFACYKMSCKVQLIVPAGYKGDILLVYGVKHQPKLKPSSFFNRNIDVVVPPSGIIFISNKFAEKYFNNLLVIDSAHRRVFEPGHGVLYTRDTLRCGSNKFNIEILNYMYSAIDSVNRKINLADRVKKKKAACDMLGRK